MKKLCLLSLGLLLWHSSQAQSPEELERWVRSVESEYPGIEDLSKYRAIKSNRWDYDRIRYNLMSDKYFVPLVGSRFDDFSSSKREKFVKSIWRFVEKNKKNTSVPQYAWVFRLSDYMSANFSSILAWEYTVQNIVILREARLEYAKFIAQLTTNSMNLEGVTALVRTIGRKFDLLMPSEIRALENGVLKKKDELTSKQVDMKLSEINRSYKKFELLENLNELLSKLKGVGIDMDHLADNLSKETNAKLVTKVTDQFNTEADKIINQAIEKLKTGSISEINSIATDIEYKYNRRFPESEERSKKFSELLEEYKLKYVRDHHQQIENELRASKNIDILESTGHHYFLGIQYGSVPELTALIKLEGDLHQKFLDAEKAAKEKKVQQVLMAEKKAMVAHGLKFTTEGLANPELAKDMMMGDFQNIRFSREAEIAADIIHDYVKAYSTMCKDLLPKNSVQIYKEVCVRKEEKVYRNHLGFEINRVSQCLSWENRPTGIYARPELYNARQVIFGLVKSHVPTNMLNDMMDAQRHGNVYTLNEAISKVLSTVTDPKDPDMFILVQKNGCTSSGLKRFEENLIRFAMDKEPIQLIKDAEISYANDQQNFRVLIEDLIIEETDNWFMKVYDRNSVKNISITEKDEKGRPKQIVANYTYLVSGHKSQDIVMLEFKDGLPKCLYFEEKYFDCRPADKNVVAKFRSGWYTSRE